MTDLDPERPYYAFFYEDSNRGRGVVFSPSSTLSQVQRECPELMLEYLEPRPLRRREITHSTINRLLVQRSRRRLREQSLLGRLINRFYYRRG